MISGHVTALVTALSRPFSEQNKQHCVGMFGHA
jgi:hypothetical protein